MRKRNEIIEEDEEMEPAAKPPLSLKYVRYLLLLVMVMVALIFLFSNRDQINGDNFRRLMAKINMGMNSVAEDNGEIRFDSATVGKTVVFKDGLAHATVEKLTITDRNGTEFQNTALGYRNPCISANSRYVFVYDSGGTGLMVADSFSVLFEHQMEHPIITARMNENGWLVVVTEGEGYLAKVFVYDASHREVYRYSSLGRYILDAAVTVDHKSVILSALNVEGGEIVPELVMFKLNKEKMEWSLPFEGSPCVHLSVKKGGVVNALFKWGMVSVSAKGAELGRYEFEKKVLQCYSMEDGGQNVFALSATENGDSQLVICNERAKAKDTVQADFYGKSLDYQNGRIALLGNRKSAVYQSSGKILWEDEPENALSIAFLQRDAVVVIGEMKSIYHKIS